MGQITSIEDHPNADGLYVEQIDFGDANPKQVGKPYSKGLCCLRTMNRLPFSIFLALAFKTACKSATINLSYFLQGPLVCLLDMQPDRKR